MANSENRGFPFPPRSIPPRRSFDPAVLEPAALALAEVWLALASGPPGSCDSFGGQCGGSGSPSSSLVPWKFFAVAVEGGPQLGRALVARDSWAFTGELGTPASAGCSSSSASVLQSSRPEVFPPKLRSSVKSVGGMMTGAQGNAGVVARPQGSGTVGLRHGGATGRGADWPAKFQNFAGACCRRAQPSVQSRGHVTANPGPACLPSLSPTCPDRHSCSVSPALRGANKGSRRFNGSMCLLNMSVTPDAASFHSMRTSQSILCTGTYLLRMMI